jgi:NTE family protein
MDRDPAAASAPPQPASPTTQRPHAGSGKSVALALGAGGARGLAHIAVLEALDDIGVRPVAIAGASVGALVGAAYAAGMSGRDIRRHVIAFAHDRGEVLRGLMAARVAPLSLSGLLSAPFGNPVLIDAEKFCAAFLPAMVPETFELLAIPLTVVAADLSARRATLFSAGPLRLAIAASMAIPGLVRPVDIGGRIHVDGGAVDPLPFTALTGRADIVVAVDCSGEPSESQQVPDPWEALFATITVMGQTIVAEKLKHGTPELLLRPRVGTFRLLDFLHASAILRAAEPIKAELKERLGALIGA